MRWNQILTESLSKYRPMFTGLYADGKVPRSEEMAIQKIERIMQREDRVIWMLRWYRFGLAHELADPDTPEGRKMLDKAKRDLGEARGWNDSACVNESDRAYNYLDDFEHFWGMPIEAIQRYVFDRQTPQEIIDHFEELQDEWQEKIGDRSVEIESGDDKLIDFGNGWAWWHLDRPYCDAEGKAMGHCGNSASYKSDDTILSLREHTHGDLWEPHCTFILDGDGFIGEMKGKGNEKPVEKYHKMIVALLENDIIYGIKGGGYAPENNFSLNDLTTEEVKRLKAMKPGLQTLNELLAAGDFEGAEKSVKRMMHARGWGFQSIDMQAKNIVLETWPTLESFCNQHVDNYNNTFNDLRDELIHMDGDLGEGIYEEFYNDYYKEVVEQHIYDFNYYKCDNIALSFTTVGGPVEMSISFYGVQEAFDPDEDNSMFRSGDDLDEIDDYSSFGDRDPQFNDDIDEGVCHLVASDGKFSVSNVAETIFRTYNREGGIHSSGSPTVNDPRQMNFDFNK
jgi:hypothetical protein